MHTEKCLVCTEFYIIDMHNACSVQISACNSYSIIHFTEMTKNKHYMHQDCVKPLFNQDNLSTFGLRRISILGGCELVELDRNYQLSNKELDKSQKYFFSP